MPNNVGKLYSKNICGVVLGTSAHKCVLPKQHQGFHKACCDPLKASYDGLLWADGTEQKKQGKLIEAGSGKSDDWGDGLYA